MLTSSWLFWAILSAAFAAAMSIFAKAGLQKIDPDVAQVLRTFVVLLFMAALIAPGGKWGETLDWSRRTWLMLILSGVATALSWLCYFRALELGDATRVAAVDKLSVAIVAVAAAVFLSERLGAVGWCGVALVSAGLVMISLKH
jgi:bacterial/archaeal transporter family protein